MSDVKEDTAKVKDEDVPFEQGMVSDIKREGSIKKASLSRPYKQRGIAQIDSKIDDSKYETATQKGSSIKPEKGTVSDIKREGSFKNVSSSKPCQMGVAHIGSESVEGEQVVDRKGNDQSSEGVLSNVDDQYVGRITASITETKVETITSTENLETTTQRHKAVISEKGNVSDIKREGSIKRATPSKVVQRGIAAVGTNTNGSIEVVEAELEGSSRIGMIANVHDVSQNDLGTGDQYTSKQTVSSAGIQQTEILTESADQQTPKDNKATEVDIKESDELAVPQTISTESVVGTQVVDTPSEIVTLRTDTSIDTSVPRVIDVVKNGPLGRVTANVTQTIGSSMITSQDTKEETVSYSNVPTDSLDVTDTTTCEVLPSATTKELPRSNASSESLRSVITEIITEKSKHKGEKLSEEIEKSNMKYAKSTKPNTQGTGNIVSIEHANAEVNVSDVVQSEELEVSLASDNLMNKAHQKHTRPFGSAETKTITTTVISEVTTDKESIPDIKQESIGVKTKVVKASSQHPTVLGKGKIGPLDEDTERVGERRQIVGEELDSQAIYDSSLSTVKTSSTKQFGVSSEGLTGTAESVSSRPGFKDQQLSQSETSTGQDKVSIENPPAVRSTTTKHGDSPIVAQTITPKVTETTPVSTTDNPSEKISPSKGRKAATVSPLTERTEEIDASTGKKSKKQRKKNKNTTGKIIAFDATTVEEDDTVDTVNDIPSSEHTSSKEMIATNTLTKSVTESDAVRTKVVSKVKKQPTTDTNLTLVPTSDNKITDDGKPDYGNASKGNAKNVTRGAQQSVIEDQDEETTSETSEETTKYTTITTSEYNIHPRTHQKAIETPVRSAKSKPQATDYSTEEIARVPTLPKTLDLDSINKSKQVDGKIRRKLHRASIGEEEDDFETMDETTEFTTKYTTTTTKEFTKRQRGLKTASSSKAQKHSLAGETDEHLKSQLESWSSLTEQSLLREQDRRLKSPRSIEDDSDAVKRALLYQNHEDNTKYGPKKETVITVNPKRLSLEDEEGNFPFDPHHLEGSPLSPVFVWNSAASNPGQRLSGGSDASGPITPKSASKISPVRPWSPAAGVTRSRPGSGRTSPISTKTRGGDPKRINTNVGSEYASGIRTWVKSELGGSRDSLGEDEQWTTEEGFSPSQRAYSEGPDDRKYASLPHTRPSATNPISITVSDEMLNRDLTSPTISPGAYKWRWSAGSDAFGSQFDSSYLMSTTPIKHLRSESNLSIYSSRSSFSGDSYEFLDNIEWEEDHLRNRLRKNEKGLLELDASSENLLELPDAVSNLKEIQALRLDCNWIRKLPEHIGNLTGLEYLSCRDSALVHLPENIIKCKAINYLDLENNMLRKLPQYLREFRKLQFLNLRFNRLAPWPRVLNFMSQLQYLDISKNTSLYHVYDRCISSLQNLKWLSLENTSLDALPKDLNKCSNLEHVNASHNYIKNLDDDLAELSHLKTFILGGNKLNEYPEVLSSIEPLEVLDISGNDILFISSSIIELKRLRELDIHDLGMTLFPESVCKMTNLTCLNASENNFSMIPEAILDMKDLKELYLEATTMTTFPNILTKLPHLEVLDLAKNDMTKISSSVKKLKNLRVLDLHDNKLLDLAPEVGELPLKKLDVSNNKLGLFPEAVCQIKTLEILLLGQNKLKHIPLNVKLMEKLRNLSLSGNDFKQFPSVVCKLESLQNLDMSSNAIVEIHDDITASKLTVFNMSKNKLVAIPTMKYARRVTLSDNKISKLDAGWRDLEEMDLKNNELQEFPNVLCESKRLRLLHLDNNCIPELPNEIGNLVRLQELTLSGNYIQEIPVNICRLFNLKTLNIRFNNVTNLPRDVDKLVKLDPNRFKWVAGAAGLIMDDDNMVEPPPAVCKAGREAIFHYMKEMRYTRAANASRRKLILVGETCAGKTSLANAILYGKSKLTTLEERTRVLEQRLWSPSEDVKFQVNDFGGHDVYTMSHQFFLTPESIYLIVFDISIYNETKYPTPIQDWIELVSAHVPNAVFKIVATHSDLCKKQKIQAKTKKIMTHLKRYEQEFVKATKEKIALVDRKMNEYDSNLKTQVLTPDGLNVQRAHLQYILENRPRLPEKVDVISSAEKLTGVKALTLDLCDMSNDVKLFSKRTLPMSWIALQESVHDSDVGRSSNIYLPWLDVHLCTKKAKLYESQLQPALAYLHQIGDILWYSHDDLLKQVIFHKPVDVVEMLRGMFRHDLHQYLQTNKEKFQTTLNLTPQKYDSMVRSLLQDGEMPRSFLKCFWADRNLDENTHKILLTLMQAFNLCYPVRASGFTPDSHKVYCFPFLISVPKPRGVNDKWPELSPEPVHIEVKLIFETKNPIGFYEKSSVMMQQVAKLRYRWRDGVYGVFNTEKVLLQRSIIDGKRVVTLAARGNEPADVWRLFLRIYYKLSHILQDSVLARYSTEFVCGHCLCRGISNPYTYPAEVLDEIALGGDKRVMCPNSTSADKIDTYTIYPPHSVLDEEQEAACASLLYQEAAPYSDTYDAYSADADEKDAVDCSYATGPLSDTSLFNLSNEIGPEWKSFGILLDFTAAELKQFEHNHPFHMQYRVFSMLTSWRDTSDGTEEHKLDALRKVMKTVGRDDLSVALNKKDEE
ncbi:unnamed protein product [Owenia fusiformis]|uniref:non-specific serine/threonine protein kinase n=1 Tax=Owenia fusiformis TaxID=6347 RepID=A0A8J1TPI3_OWEFU|nr:unnamed protein product [Owenia fusiformis]